MQVGWFLPAVLVALTPLLPRGCLSTASYARQYYGSGAAAAAGGARAKAYESENRLINDLLSGYNRWVLPTANNSYSVKVLF